MATPLPDSSQFTGPDVKEDGFKAAMDQLIVCLRELQYQYEGTEDPEALTQAIAIVEQKRHETVNAAAAAAQSALQAELDAAAANAAADRSVNAADTTVASANSFDTLAAAQLATDAGRFALDQTVLVRKAGNPQLFDKYRNNAGVLVDTGEDVSIASAAALELVRRRSVSAPVATPLGPSRFAQMLVVGGAIVSAVTVGGDALGPDSVRLGAVEQRVEKIPVSAPLGPSRYAYSLVVGGAIVSATTDSGQSVTSDADEGDAGSDVATQVVPLGPSRFLRARVVGGAITDGLTIDGLFLSSHTHAEISSIVEAQGSTENRVKRLEAKAKNTLEYLCWNEVVGGKDQIMIHDGSQIRQLTDGLSNYSKASVSMGRAIRMLTDKFTGTLEPACLAGTGELFLERVLQHKLGTGQSLTGGSRGFERDKAGVVKFVQDVSGEVFSKVAKWPRDALMFTQVGTKTWVYNNPPGSAADGGGTETTTLTPTSLLTDFEPLREQFNRPVCGETIFSGFANAFLEWCSTACNVGRRMLFSASFQGGTPYSGLKKGTTCYAAAIRAVTQAHSVSAAKGWKHYVSSLTILHGEAQTGTSAATYAGYLEEWRSDYEADIKALISYQPTLPAFVSQMNTQTAANVDIPVGQLLAHDNYPNIALTGPKYQYPYYDGSHMLAEGYHKAGELESIFERHWLAGRKAHPLRIVSAVLSGSTVTLTYDNLVAGDSDSQYPVGALELDTVTLTNPGNCGFGLADSPTITGIALGADKKSIVLTCSVAPAVGTFVTYALQTNLSSPQTGNGPRGNVRCGARLISQFDGLPLTEWAVAQRIAITSA